MMTRIGTMRSDDCDMLELWYDVLIMYSPLLRYFVFGEQRRCDRIIRGWFSCAESE